MNYMDFREVAIESSELYLKFLKDNDRGIAKAKVTRIEIHGKEVLLHLHGRISPAGLDSISLQFYAEDPYPTNAIQPIDYQSETGILTIRPRKDVFDLLCTVDCDHVFIISDLRFLVERVGKWYESNPVPFALPNVPPHVIIPRYEDMAGGTPSDEQYSAVCGVLSSPLSYVWGAPGTGKTRFVLANCVLAYLREDKKVLLVAPTNNALDQMLSGTLEVLLSYGIPQTRIRRLGIPSRDFSSQYPGVCERRSTELRRLHLTKQIEQLRNQIKAASSFNSIQSDLSVLTSICDSAHAATNAYDSSCVPDNTVISILTSAGNEEKSMDALSQQIDELSIWCESFPGRLCRFFFPKVYSQKKASLSQKIHDRDSAAFRHSSLQHQIESYNAINTAATDTYYTELKALFKQFSKLCQTSSNNVLKNFSSVSFGEFPACLETALSLIRSQCKSLEMSSVLTESDIDHLSVRLRQSELELSHLDCDNQSSWSEVRVLAMTIDRYISSNFSATYPDFEPSHIFMDEAAYCSLIKGFTLLCLGCPLTLLGDHAQLPPVCEMSDSNFKDGRYQSVFLWAQSAIYIESAFKKSYIELYEDYSHGLAPIFRELRCYALSVTYRFGPGLSQILSEFVYSHDFRSAKNEETNIKYLSVPNSSVQGVAPRSSQAECNAISLLVRALSSEHIDFAVLTPYKNQLDLLTKQMKRVASAGRIMTVHASQGREFHTVILSVVDTSNKYYTNSSIPVGRSVLNTAISRAKNNLILVLDSDYWSTQNNQLIGHLLHIASPYQFQKDTPSSANE